MKKLPHVLVALILPLLGACVRANAPDDAVNACNALVGTKMAAGVVEEARPVTAGQTISLSGAKQDVIAPFGFCRVAATLHSEAASEIHSEFWLPEPKAWNGKFVGLGNGGFGGVIPEMYMFAPLRQGYAVAATDTGHSAGFSKTLALLDGQWSYKQPVRVLDWAFRANHITAQGGKELLRHYFGQAPKRSYFHGCSDGGREALMEAGRYPDDYDGILAGAPAAAFTDVAAQFVWNARHVAPTQLTSEKLKMLHTAVLSQCDALDGVKDGLLENPLACNFDPAVLQCNSEDAKGCLTKTEVRAVRAIYQGPRTRQGSQVSSGFSFGGEYEEGWGLWITGPTVPVIGTLKSVTGQSLLSTDFFRWMVFGDPDWKREQIDLDRDWPIARERLAATINSDELDLTGFFKRENKLLLYHGWADAALPPQNTINYYDKLRARHGEPASQRVRLFMAPGMAHCGSGPGPNVFDALGALDQWVEGGPPPETIIASKHDNDQAAALGLPAKVLRTRPLCAWPKVARWNGKGSSDAAENFSCVEPNQP